MGATTEGDDMLAIIAAAVGVAVFAVWGAFWAFVRDQGQPSYMTQSEKDARGDSKWKESGIALFGLLAALLWFATRGGEAPAILVAMIPEAYPVGINLVIAALIWAGMSGTWSLGHDSGMGLYDATDYWQMAWTGGVVTLVPAVALAVEGHYVLAPIVLAAGMAKALTYDIAYRIRGRAAPWPHASAFGHVAHGAIAQGVTAAAIVLAHA